MTLLIFKALHIIGLVLWFAALLILGYLFKHHKSALTTSSVDEQLVDAERRLFAWMANPAMLLTLFGGIGMLIINSAYLMQGWIHIKLTFVLILLAYHHLCIPIIRQFRQGISPRILQKFAFFNDLPLTLLVAIVVLSVLKSGVHTSTLLIITAIAIIVSLVTVRLIAQLGQKKR